MSTRPWMPLYVADYLADTGEMSTIEHGAYLLLIMHYWSNGSLPTDEAKLKNIAKMSAHNWKKSRDTLQKKFDAGWKHKRIEQELEKVRAISEKRSKAAQDRHDKERANAPANAVQEQTHSHSDSQDSSFIQGDELFPEGQQPMTRANQRRFEWPKDYRDQFWNEWPEKRAKKPAIAALERAHAADKADFNDILEGIRRYIRTKPPDRDWMLPTTFLNQERWNDEPSANQPNRSNGRPQPLRGGEAIAAGVRAAKDAVLGRNAFGADFAEGFDADREGSSRNPARDLELPFRVVSRGPGQ